MADSWQAQQAQIGCQSWFDDLDLTSSLEAQPQPEPDQTTVPGSHDSDPQTAQGWQTLDTRGSGHQGFNPEAFTMSQPISAQAGGSSSGLITLHHRNSGSQSRWQRDLEQVPAQSGDSSSTLIPPSLPQRQAPVSQLGGSNPELPSSQPQPQWQASSSSDPQHFHPPLTLTDPHRSESPFSSFQATVTENLTRVKNIRTSHKRDSEAFTFYGDTKRARNTGKRAASNTESIVISPDASMKDLAYKDMVQRVFEIGLFPTADGITIAANAALDAVIGSDASQSARLANLAQNASSFDVTVRLSMENSVARLVQAPLAHPSVTALLDYMLVTKKYSSYLCTLSGDWKARFQHAFAFSAAICRDEFRRVANAGWINAAAGDFSMSEVEAAYDAYTDYISSLTGDQKVIFEQMMSSSYQMHTRASSIAVKTTSVDARQKRKFSDLVGEAESDPACRGLDERERSSDDYLQMPKERARDEERLVQDQSVEDIQLLVTTQAQQLRDSQDRIDSLHAQLFHLRDRLYDVERARNIAERHVEALQTLKSGGQRRENGTKLKEWVRASVCLCVIQPVTPIEMSYPKITKPESLARSFNLSILDLSNISSSSSVEIIH
ncbi:hypothetical protein EDD22DRAFT_846606 [Suillus occidentalis]|nr:hypothetical protein EDD22DRAFT_846606 [Suillus occidentalis]